MNFYYLLNESHDSPTVVRIEDVKPTPTATRDALIGYGTSCAILSEHAEAAWQHGAAAHGGLKHPHPWFGPIDAATWFCLAATHLGLHREQIRRILNRM